MIVALSSYGTILRPRQWTKNLIVFAAPLFALRTDLATVLGSLLAFLVLCMTSSGFYIWNDVADLDSDRRHPAKRRRPIASGAVSIPVALALGSTLPALGLAVGWTHSRGLGGIVTAYALLQVAYNLKLKRMVILDVMAIATGFVLRAVAGAAATDLPVSSWFLLCTALLALFLGFEKRKAELRLLGERSNETRSVLGLYSLPLLSRMETIAAAGAVVTYAIWASGPQVHGASTPWMLLTTPFVLYGVFRYQLLSTPREGSDGATAGAGQGRTERPEEILLSDPPILLTTLAWALAGLVIMLLKEHGQIR
jgi:4-hydroxybenzoate polyprenyltransferase